MNKHCAPAEHMRNADIWSIAIDGQRYQLAASECWRLCPTEAARLEQIGRSQNIAQQHGDLKAMSPLIGEEDAAWRALIKALHAISPQHQTELLE
jgi:hypothetical protein